MSNRIDRLRALKGRRVSLALVGDSQIDGCQVISAARGPAQGVWVLSNGVDSFVPLAEVVDWWEVPPPGGYAA